MADGFELLKAYIALAVKDGDISKVKGQIGQIKSALGGLKSTGKNSLKNSLDIVGAKGFGGKNDLGELKKVQDAITKQAAYWRKAADASAIIRQKEQEGIEATLRKQQEYWQKARAGSKALRDKQAADAAAKTKAENEAIAAAQRRQQEYWQKARLGSIRMRDKQQGKEDADVKKQLEQQQAYWRKAFAESQKLRRKEESDTARAQQKIRDYWTKTRDRVMRYNEQLAKASERAAAASERAWAKSAREMNQAFQRTTRFIGNISLEVGFLAPQLQSLGNILRTGFQFANVGFAGGSKLGGGANPFGALFGGIGALTGFLGGTGFALATKALSVFLSVVTRITQAIGRVAWSTFASGINLLFAPTLGLVKAFRLVLQYLPLIVTSIGVGLVQSLSAASIQMERLRNLFGVAFLGKADVQLQKMITLADRMGFSFEDAAEPMAKLTFAAQQAGIELSSVDSLFRGVATAASALRLDNERLSRAFVALEQVISKGRVSSEELRQQLAESIPGIVPIVQRALGLSGQAFDDLLRKGELTAKTLIEALGPELERTFRSGAKANADSLSASVARVRNQFLLLRAELGDRIAPAFVKLQLAMLRFARSNQVFSFLQRMVDGLARMFDLIRTSPLIQEFGRQFIRIFSAIRQDLQDVISKFIRISVIANGTLLIGLTRLAQGVLPVINRLLDRVLLSIEKMSGIKVDSIADAFAFVGALGAQFKKLPAIFDAVLNSVFTRLRLFVSKAVNTIEAVTPVIVRMFSNALLSSLDNVFKEVKIDSLRDEIDDIQNQITNGVLNTDADREALREGIENKKKEIQALNREIMSDIRSSMANVKEDIAEAFASAEPPAQGLVDAIAKADAAVRDLLSGAREVFKFLKFREQMNSLLLDISSGAASAIDAIQQSFSRFSASLDGTWGKITEGIGRASGQFFGAGKSFLRDLKSGQNPFFALGTAIGEASKSLQGNVKVDTSALDESLKSFRAEFFDSDSFFKALQGSDQSSLREQKRTNDKLDEINKNIQEGNRIRATSTGFNSDLRFRGAIA